MIYNRWGDTLTIKANCGQQKPKGSKYSSRLVLANHQDGREAFYFIHTLKSEGGMAEIEKTALAASEVTLPRNILHKAIEEAS